MIKAGITGGSGSGKSFILNVWAQQGVYVIDTDKIYHGLLESSFALRLELYSRFGKSVFKNERVDRTALAAVVFNDHAALEDLNSITHRHVIGETFRLIDSHNPEYVAIDAIALIESGIAAECDAVVCVIADREQRINRIVSRDGISRESAIARISAQKPDDYYIDHCGFVVYNNMDEQQLKEKSMELFNRIFKLREKGNINTTQIQE